MVHVTENLENVVQKIRAAKNKYLLKDKTTETQLIAVSKTFSASQIRPLLVHGHRHFGENKLQEAQQKWVALKQEYPDIYLHMIGSLQSNKAKDAILLFDRIHALDRESLAKKLANLQETGHKIPPCLVQVNIGKESQKSGVLLQEFSDFIVFCKDLKLPIDGLMCLPPIGENAAPFFLMLKEMAQQYNLPHLSMGMSQDFELATAMGASFVRVGSSIFGNRV